MIVIRSKDIYDLSKKLHYTSKFNKLLDDVISRRIDKNKNLDKDINIKIITKNRVIVNDLEFYYKGYKVIIEKYESNYITNNTAIVLCNELINGNCDELIYAPYVPIMRIKNA